MEPQTRPPERPADRLRRAPPEERPAAFRETYEVVLRRVLEERERTQGHLHLGGSDKIARYIRASIGGGRSVLEIGCGFGSSALVVGRGQREMVGVDAAPVAVEVATRRAAGQPHMRFVAMDATRLQFPDRRFEIAYSVDLVEHLHPDDLPLHLQEVHRVLVPGGLYIVKTPSELTGPHEGDDPGEQGFLHFREYRYGTLLPLLRRAGFEHLAAPAFSLRLASRLPGRSRFPASINAAAERLAVLAPERSPARRRLARFLGLKQVIVSARRG